MSTFHCRYRSGSSSNAFFRSTVRSQEIDSTHSWTNSNHVGSSYNWQSKKKNLNVNLSVSVYKKPVSCDVYFTFCSEFSKHRLDTLEKSQVSIENYSYYYKQIRFGVFVSLIMLIGFHSF